METPDSIVLNNDAPSPGSEHTEHVAHTTNLGAAVKNANSTDDAGNLLDSEDARSSSSNPSRVESETSDSMQDKELSGSGDDSSSLESLDSENGSSGDESMSEKSIFSSEFPISPTRKRKQKDRSLDQIVNHSLLQYHFNDVPNSTTTARKTKSVQSVPAKRNRVNKSPNPAPTATRAPARVKERTSDEMDAYILQSAERWRSKRRKGFDWGSVARRLGIRTAEVRARYEQLTRTTDTTHTATTLPTITLHTTTEQDAYLLHTVDTAVRKKTGVYWSVVAQRLNCTVAEAKAHWQRLVAVPFAQANELGGDNGVANDGSSSSDSIGSSMNGMRTDSETLEPQLHTVTDTTFTSISITANSDPDIQLTDASVHAYILQCVHAQSYLLHPPSTTTIPNADTANITRNFTIATPTIAADHRLSTLWRQLSVELGIRVTTLASYWDKELKQEYEVMYRGEVPATPLPHPGAGLSHAQTTQLCREVYAWAGQGQGLWARLALLLHTPSAELMAAWTRITPQEVQLRWVDRACNMAVERCRQSVTVSGTSSTNSSSSNRSVKAQLSPDCVVNKLLPLLRVDHEQCRDEHVVNSIRSMVAQHPFVKDAWCKWLSDEPNAVYRCVRTHYNMDSTSSISGVDGDISTCMNHALTAVELTLQVDTALHVNTTTPSALRRRQHNEVRCVVQCVVCGIVCTIVDDVNTLQPLQAHMPLPLQVPHLNPLPSIQSVTQPLPPISIHAPHQIPQVHTPPSNPLYTLPPTIQSIWSSSVHTPSLPQRWQFSHDAAVMLALMQAHIYQNSKSSNATNATSIDWVGLATAQGCSVEVVRQRGAQLMDLYQCDCIPIDNWFNQTVRSTQYNTTCNVTHNTTHYTPNTNDNIVNGVDYRCSGDNSSSRYCSDNSVYSIDSRRSLPDSAAVTRPVYSDHSQTNMPDLVSNTTPSTRSLSFISDTAENRLTCRAFNANIAERLPLPPLPSVCYNTTTPLPMDSVVMYHILRRRTRWCTDCPLLTTLQCTHDTLQQREKILNGILWQFRSDVIAWYVAIDEREYDVTRVGSVGSVCSASNVGNSGMSQACFVVSGEDMSSNSSGSGSDYECEFAPEPIQNDVPGSITATSASSICTNNSNVTATGTGCEAIITAPSAGDSPATTPTPIPYNITYTAPTTTLPPLPMVCYSSTTTHAPHDSCMTLTTDILTSGDNTKIMDSSGKITTPTLLPIPDVCTDATTNTILPISTTGTNDTAYTGTVSSTCTGTTIINDSGIVVVDSNEHTIDDTHPILLPTSTMHTSHAAMVIPNAGADSNTLLPPPLLFTDCNVNTISPITLPLTTATINATITSDTSASPTARSTLPPLPFVCYGTTQSTLLDSTIMYHMLHAQQTQTRVDVRSVAAELQCSVSVVSLRMAVLVVVYKKHKLAVEEWYERLVDSDVSVGSSSGIDSGNTRECCIVSANDSSSLVDVANRDTVHNNAVSSDSMSCADGGTSVCGSGRQHMTYTHNTTDSDVNASYDSRWDGSVEVSRESGYGDGINDTSVAGDGSRGTSSNTGIDDHSVNHANNCGYGDDVGTDDNVSETGSRSESGTSASNSRKRTNTEYTIPSDIQSLPSNIRSHQAPYTYDAVIMYSIIRNIWGWMKHDTAALALDLNLPLHTITMKTAELTTLYHRYKYILREWFVSQIPPSTLHILQYTPCVEQLWRNSTPNRNNSGFVFRQDALILTLLLQNTRTPEAVNWNCVTSNINLSIVELGDRVELLVELYYRERIRVVEWYNYTHPFRNQIDNSSELSLSHLQNSIGSYFDSIDKRLCTLPSLPATIYTTIQPNCIDNAVMYCVVRDIFHLRTYDNHTLSILLKCTELVVTERRAYMVRTFIRNRTIVHAWFRATLTAECHGNKASLSLLWVQSIPSTHATYKGKYYAFTFVYDAYILSAVLHSHTTLVSVDLVGLAHECKLSMKALRRRVKQLVELFNRQKSDVLVWFRYTHPSVCISDDVMLQVPVWEDALQRTNTMGGSEGDGIANSVGSSTTTLPTPLAPVPPLPTVARSVCSDAINASTTVQQPLTPLPPLPPSVPTSSNVTSNAVYEVIRREWGLVTDPTETTYSNNNQNHPLHKLVFSAEHKVTLHQWAIQILHSNHTTPTTTTPCIELLWIQSIIQEPTARRKPFIFTHDAAIMSQMLLSAHERKELDFPSLSLKLGSGVGKVKARAMLLVVLYNTDKDRVRKWFHYTHSVVLDRDIVLQASGVVQVHAVVSTTAKRKRVPVVSAAGLATFDTAATPTTTMREIGDSVVPAAAATTTTRVTTLPPRTTTSDAPTLPTAKKTKNVARESVTNTTSNTTSTTDNTTNSPHAAISTHTTMPMEQYTIPTTFPPLPLLIYTGVQNVTPLSIDCAVVYSVMCDKFYIMQRNDYALAQLLHCAQSLVQQRCQYAVQWCSDYPVFMRKWFHDVLTAECSVHPDPALTVMTLWLQSTPQHTPRSCTFVHDASILSCMIERARTTSNTPVNWSILAKTLQYSHNDIVTRAAQLLELYTQEPVKVRVWYNATHPGKEWREEEKVVLQVSSEVDGGESSSSSNTGSNITSGAPVYSGIAVTTTTSVASNTIAASTPHTPLIYTIPTNIPPLPSQVYTHSTLPISAHDPIIVYSVMRDKLGLMVHDNTALAASLNLHVDTVTNTALHFTLEVLPKHRQRLHAWFYDIWKGTCTLFTTTTATTTRNTFDTTSTTTSTTAAPTIELLVFHTHVNDKCGGFKLTQDAAIMAAMLQHATIKLHIDWNNLIHAPYTRTIMVLRRAGLLVKLYNTERERVNMWYMYTHKKRTVAEVKDLVLTAPELSGIASDMTSSTNVGAEKLRRSGSGDGDGGKSSDESADDWQDSVHSDSPFSSDSEDSDYTPHTKRVRSGDGRIQYTVDRTKNVVNGNDTTGSLANSDIRSRRGSNSSTSEQSVTSDIHATSTNSNNTTTDNSSKATMNTNTANTTNATIDTNTTSGAYSVLRDIPPLPLMYQSHTTPHDNVIMYSVIRDKLGLMDHNNAALAQTLNLPAQTVTDISATLAAELIHKRKLVLHTWFHNYWCKHYSNHANDAPSMERLVLYTETGAGGLTLSHDAAIMSALIEHATRNVPIVWALLTPQSVQHTVHRAGLLVELYNSERERVNKWYLYTHKKRKVAEVKDLVLQAPSLPSTPLDMEGVYYSTAGYYINSSANTNDTTYTVPNDIPSLPPSVKQVLNHTATPHDHTIMYSIVRDAWGLCAHNDDALAQLLAVHSSTITTRRAQLTTVFNMQNFRFVVHEWFHNFWRRQFIGDNYPALSVELLWFYSTPSKYGFVCRDDAALLSTMLLDKKKGRKTNWYSLKRLFNTVIKTKRRAAELVNLHNTHRDRVVHWYNYIHKNKRIRSDMELIAPEVEPATICNKATKRKIVSVDSDGSEAGSNIGGNGSCVDSDSDSEEANKRRRSKTSTATVITNGNTTSTTIPDTDGTGTSSSRLKRQRIISTASSSSTSVVNSNSVSPPTNIRSSGSSTTINSASSTKKKLKAVICDLTNDE